MSITPRNITLSFLIMLIAMTFLVTVDEFYKNQTTLLFYLDIFTFVCFLGLLWVAWQGWPYAGLVLVIFSVVMMINSLSEPYLTQELSILIMIPPVFAMVLTRPRWIVISAVTSFVGLLWRAEWSGVYAESFNIILYSMIVGCLILGWMVANNATKMADRARFDAEQATSALQVANDSLEQRVTERTAEVQANLVQLGERATEQAHLLAEIEQQRLTIRNLSVPVIPINDTTLVMPLVGELDTQRLAYIHTQALQALERSHARMLIIDITGVPVVDTQIAQGLMRVSQAARLLGGKVVLVGIRPEVAQTIVGLGMDITSVTTYSDLKSAMLRASN